MQATHRENRAAHSAVAAKVDGRAARQYAPGIVAALVVLAVIVASAVIIGSIDQKLKKSAEQQVITFTEQAANGVSDRMRTIQNVLAAFTVQSGDPRAIAPALKELETRFSLSGAAFCAMDGTGCDADSTPFSTDDLSQPETAISTGRMSYSETFINESGQRVRLAQKPLFLDGQQIGALYIQVPLELFAMPRKLDMFDGRGYFLLFEADSGEILLPPSEQTLTPIDEGMTLYRFLEVASEDEKPPSLLNPSAERGNPNGPSRMDELRQAIASDQTCLVNGLIDDRESYVCVAPVGTSGWFVCNIIPRGNVRAEASSVVTAFQIVFGIVIACLIIIVAFFFLSYRKRLRARNVAMKTRLFNALSDSIDMAVSLYSPTDGAVTPIVAKESEIFSHSLEDMMRHRRTADRIGLSEEGRDLLRRIAAGDIAAAEKGEFSHRGGDGHLHWVGYAVSPLVYEGKQQVLIVMRDITADKQLQLSMTDAMKAADAANRAKSEFLSRMSHEIRTPMNAIIGMLQIAQKSTNDEQKTRENLRKIDAASEHLLNLINDVLDISKIESGKMALASESFDIRALAEDAAAVVRPMCEQKHQTFSLALPDGPVVCSGDAKRLSQLLVNLLTNSTKYTPEHGHVRLEVRVHPSSAAGYCRATFVVADDGIGMAPAFQEHLFEPFVMEERSGSQGTGLGMPIVRNIVTMMGGDIHVDSEVDRGTTFTVTLDLKLLPDDECPAHTATCEGVHDLAGVRVLLAEDNELNAEIAQELLADAGLIVDRAENGRVACHLFEEAAPGAYDVVLMDVQMPEMDGYEATRCIRALARPDAARVPIIAMSANAFQEDVNRSLEAGMNAHLSKPIDMAKVLATIASQLRHAVDR